MNFIITLYPEVSNKKSVFVQEDNYKMPIVNKTITQIYSNIKGMYGQLNP